METTTTTLYDRQRLFRRWRNVLATGGVFAALLVGVSAATAAPHDHGPADYDQNLELIRSSSVRNTNHDASPWRDTAQTALDIQNHLGPRSDYLGTPGGNTERAFPVAEGGQFRVSCEFSHFAYDDPLIFPGEPGAAHLHMYWGNTDANAYSTYESLIDSGSSTCNGQELNRTAYWAPAVIDGDGNARIPERIDVYYKGYGQARGESEVYPEGAAMIAEDLHLVSYNEGGAEGEFSFLCSDQWRGARTPAANTIPNCDGDRFLKEYGVTDNPHVNLEMHVKFPNCWNGNDASNPDNWSPSLEGGWFYSSCLDQKTFPNIEYIIQYRVNIGETTEGWFLSSDVGSDTLTLDSAPGSTVHADWWGGWHPEINQQWIDNCVNFKNDDGTPSGCGQGYLTDGGPDGRDPLPGPALKFRPQYDGPSSVPIAVLFNELCTVDRTITESAEAAYCNTNGSHDHGGPTTTTTQPTSTTMPTPITTAPTASTTPTSETTVPRPPSEPVHLCQGEVATIVGTEGDDEIRGTSGPDVIVGLGGSDRILGRGDNDLICAGDGDDVVYGGDGNDVIFGGEGNDRLAGQNGDDAVVGEAGNDRLYGHAGNDELVDQIGIDRLSGGDGNDELTASGSDDWFRPGSGQDIINS